MWQSLVLLTKAQRRKADRRRQIVWLQKKYYMYIELEFRVSTNMFEFYSQNIYKLSCFGAKIETD